MDFVFVVLVIFGSFATKSSSAMDSLSFSAVVVALVRGVI